MERITESESLYRDIDQKSINQILTGINTEDARVALAVKEIIPAIEKLVEDVYPKMKSGGRLFYIGAGTSGRLGIVDASECPPTFGVPFGMVVGIIAGGDGAIRKAVEFAEDDKEQGWLDLQQHEINTDDTVIGIAASGTTPYVLGALEKCNAHGILTGCITCNPGSPVSQVARYPLVCRVGPEFITGSTRMKSGTAQKLVLNMISTSVMIKLGRVKGNRMVDMQLSNLKLIDRGTRVGEEAAGQRGVAQQLHAARAAQRHQRLRRAAVEQRALHLHAGELHARLDHCSTMRRVEIGAADEIDLPGIGEFLQPQRRLLPARHGVVPPVELHEVEPLEAEAQQRAVDDAHDIRPVERRQRGEVGHELGVHLHARERLRAVHGEMPAAEFADHLLDAGIDSAQSKVTTDLSRRVRPMSHPLAPPEEIEPTLEVITRKPVAPGSAEIIVNPRARSAKLRAARKVTAHTGTTS